MAKVLKRWGGAAVAGGLAALLLLGGCGGEDGARTAADTAPAQRSATDRPPAEPREAAGERERAESVEPARCPDGVADCRSATGRVVYVERVDPDGDGDAHFVILDRQSITLPGLTAIDLRAGLRPNPLPGPGDVVSAAGPVQTGSVGQSQIHALSFNVTGGG